MTDILVPDRDANQRAAQYGLDILPATFGEGFGAAFDEALTRNATPSLLRWMERQNQSAESAIRGEFIPPDEANAKYGIPGRLSFDQPISEPVARELQTLKRAEIERQDVIRRSQAGAGTLLTAGLVASILDPLNLAAAFIPVIGEGMFAGMVARTGLGTARAMKGAAEGIVGTAALEPLVYGVAQQEQADYTAMDSVMNLAFGTVMGAGLHLGAGYLGDRFKGRAEAAPIPKTIDTLPVSDQAALLRTAVAQVAEDRPVDVGAVMDAARPRVTEERLPIPTVEREAMARQIDPEIFKAVEGIRAETSTLQLQLETLKAEVKKPEIVAAAERINEIDRQVNDPETDWRKARDMAVESDILVEQFSRPKMAEALADYAKQGEKQAEIVASIEKRLGDLGNRMADANRRIAAAYKEAGDRLAASPEYRQKVVAEARKSSQFHVEPEVAQASVRATERSQPEAGPPKPIDEEIQSVEAAIAEEERFLPADSKPDAEVQEMLREATVYQKAYEAAASCRMRKS